MLYPFSLIFFSAILDGLADVAIWAGKELLLGAGIFLLATVIQK
jgi:hypothetical protein